MQTGFFFMFYGKENVENLLVSLLLIKHIGYNSHFLSFHLFKSLKSGSNFKIHSCLIHRTDLTSAVKLLMKWECISVFTHETAVASIFWLIYGTEQNLWKTYRKLFSVLCIYDILNAWRFLCVIQHSIKLEKHLNICWNFKQLSNLICLQKNTWPLILLNWLSPNGQKKYLTDNVLPFFLITCMHFLVW